MKISLEWLRDYLERDLTAAEAAEALTLVGFEVEGIETHGLPPLEKVVVGEILSREPHPNADRLGVCAVQVEPDREPLQIVCGATNYKVGDRVPTALIGAVLPGDFTIKKSKLRGVESSGMLCSGKELGLSEDGAGLLILEDRPPVGTPVNDLFPGPVTVLDIEVTPNRPDCLSHLGIARDLAAWFRADLKYPEISRYGSEEVMDDAGALLDSVELEAGETCPHYRAYTIRGVTIAPSPDWLARRLEAIGLRPINNVVDVTNYVLHELGQPLHAFDAATIGGGRIRVRKAVNGETITTLDGRQRTLTGDDLVIADAERPMVIAGVMGSEDVEVTATTTDIVLEAAYFNPVAIRRTSRRLALSTDSSYRFERGVDPHGVVYAAERAIDLILATAGGRVSREVRSAGSAPLTENEIRIEPQMVRDRLGFGPDDEEMRGILESLELGVHRNDEDGSWNVSVPSFRLDLERPVDLVEEVLRIYGSNRIPESGVAVRGLAGKDTRGTTIVNKAVGFLASNRFHEAYSYTLRKEAEVLRWGGPNAGRTCAVANPLASDQSHLRVSLLPCLLDILHFNQSRVDGDLRFFESGRVYREQEGRVREAVSVGLVVLERGREASWLLRERSDFFTVKGLLQRLLDHVGVASAVDFNQLRPVADADSPWVPDRSGVVGDFWKDGWTITCGYLSRDVLEAQDLRDPVLAAEIVSLPNWERVVGVDWNYQPVSTFPASSKDLALIVPQGLPAGEVRATLERIASAATGSGFGVEDVSCFDVYEGTGIPEGSKSLAFSLRYRAQDRTLKEAEINDAFEGLQRAIAAETGFTVRK